MYGHCTTKTTLGSSVRLLRTNDSPDAYGNEIGIFRVLCCKPRCRTEFGWVRVCQTDEQGLFIVQFDLKPEYVERSNDTEQNGPPLIERGRRVATSPTGKTRKPSGLSPDGRVLYLSKASENMRREVQPHSSSWAGQTKTLDGRPTPTVYTIFGFNLPKRLHCHDPKCDAISVIAQEVVPMTRTSMAS